MIVLNYIKNETRRFQTFVANRVTEIRELSQQEQWRHCPTKSNPADDVSRGMEMDEFLKNERWIKGPHFLTKPDEEWPKDKFEVQADDHLEITKELYHINLEASSAIDQLHSRSSCWIETLIE